MDTLQAIARRRSVRHFTSDPVSDGLVRTLLEAAMAATLRANMPAWQFVVADRRDLFERIFG